MTGMVRRRCGHKQGIVCETKLILALISKEQKIARACGDAFGIIVRVMSLIGYQSYQTVELMINGDVEYICPVGGCWCTGVLSQSHPSVSYYEGSAQRFIHVDIPADERRSQVDCLQGIISFQAAFESSEGPML